MYEEPGFRVRKNAAPLKPALSWYTPRQQVDSAFVRTRPH